MSGMAVSLALYTLMEYSFSDPEDSLLSMIRFESTGSSPNPDVAAASALLAILIWLSI